MMVYVTGGSGSGKSAFAENLIVESGLFTRHYIATMEVWDAEGQARVERHRAMRADKGFVTVECPTVTPIDPTVTGAVLVEDLTNLLMNQWFAVDKTTAVAQVAQWVEELQAHCQLLVVVGNDITQDGQRYDEEMNGFLQALGALSCQVAQSSHQVYQVSCGIATALQPMKGVGGMTLIIGGKYQGKTAYAQALAQETGAPIVDDLAQWLRTQPSPEEALQALDLPSNAIVVCDQVGCGVVPLDKEERAWRERVGRVCTQLAQQATCVVEVVCGIPRVIKE